MAADRRRLRAASTGILTALLITGAACSATGDAAPSDAPAARVIGPVAGGDGRPFNAMPAGMADDNGYTETEFFVEGAAHAFVAVGALEGDGHWRAEAGDEAAPYRVRILVRRPISAARFNGTVLVEWLNVSAGRDADVEFGFAHDEIFREGYAYVGVSAQAVGVTGEGIAIPVPDVDALPLREVDPERYGSLQHPGDDYSYDIFAQVATRLREPENVDPLDGLEPGHLIAVGESQSAARLTTFVNAVQPLGPVFDGFLIHSRGAGAAPLESADVDQQPETTTLRRDLDAPILQFETETDLRVLGFLPARQPDSGSVRTWEVAGTAHADRTMLDYAAASIHRSAPDATLDVASSCGTVNDGPQGDVLQAALHALNAWVTLDAEPPRAPPIEVVEGALDRDQHGIVLGGVRSPAVDAPTATLTGERDPGDPTCRAFGATIPFDDATLAELYPTHAAYVAAVTDAADAAVTAGLLRPADADTLVAEAGTADVP
jgi:hypothetical protein